MWAPRRCCCPGRRRRARSSPAPGGDRADRPRRRIRHNTRSADSVSEPTTPAAEQSNPQLGGTDTRVRPDAGPTEGGRPLLMDPAGARPPGFAPPTASPWAPGAPTVAARPGPPNTHSVLAGPTPVTPAPTLPASRSEAAFGPVSRVVTISIRTPSSRVDLALPDRTSIAEVLETVLDVAPRSLREQALAHGGWILRTAAG